MTNLADMLDLLAEEFAAQVGSIRLYGDEDGDGEEYLRDGVAGALLDIARLLNRACALADQLHVRPYLEAVTLDHPASRRLCVLYALARVTGVSGRQREVLQWLALHGPATVRDIESQTDMLYNTIRHCVYRLAEAGLVEAVDDSNYNTEFRATLDGRNSA